MRVTSPVGEYEYVVKRVRLRRGRIVVEGGLGVWDTTMEIEPRDWVALGRRAAAPLALLALATIVARRQGRFLRTGHRE